MADDRISDGAADAELIREGEYWSVRFEDRDLRIRNTKGMGYLAQLLAHPNREIEVLALAGGGAVDQLSPAEIRDAGLVRDGPSGDPLLDEQARRAYRDRLEDLHGEIEEADAFHDPERSARAREELQAVTDELMAATGLHGRDRRMGTPTERARLNVTRAIRSTIARVAEHHAALGEHLSSCVQTGRTCVYRPPRLATIVWTVQTRSTARPIAHRTTMLETSYAHNGDLSIAYQVVGDGPVDAILVNGLAANLDLWWADSDGAAVLRRLASCSRLMLFDKPGTGLSDPVAGAPSLEQRVDDILAVMDAAGSDRATVIGYSEGGLASALFAATYPERTESLVLLNSGARSKPGPGLAPAFDQLWRCLDELIVERWGEGAFMLEMAPSWAGNATRRKWAGFFERACASPGMARAMVAALREYDVRPVLPAISVPTLVIHASDERVLAVDFGRELARLIPNARYVEVPGVDHLFFAGNWEPIVSEIETFLATELPQQATERLLQTVLFLDAGSFDREQRDAIVRSELLRYEGRLVESFDQRILATFDGPSRAVRAGRAIVAALGRIGVQSGAGIHTGECEIAYHDLTSTTLRIGDHLATLAAPCEVLVSRTVCDLVGGSGIEFSDRGEHALNGATGRWQLYAATGDQAADARHVDTVDAHVAALTPGPRAAMSRSDRVTLALAGRAPGVVRRVTPRHRRQAPP